MRGKTLRKQQRKRSRFSEEQIIGILKENEVEFAFAQPRKPVQNAFVERFDGPCVMSASTNIGLNLRDARDINQNSTHHR